MIDLKRKLAGNCANVPTFRSADSVNKIRAALFRSKINLDCANWMGSNGLLKFLKIEGHVIFSQGRQLEIQITRRRYIFVCFSIFLLYFLFCFYLFYGMLRSWKKFIFNLLCNYYLQVPSYSIYKVVQHSVSLKELFISD